MSTETPVAEVAAPVAKTRAPRDPNAPARSFGATLQDSKGNQLRFRADQKKSGWITYVEHVVVAKDGTKTKSRGAGDKHESKEQAEKMLNKGVAAATTAGWAKVSGGGGFRSKPDAFSLSTLPAPVKK